MTTAYALDLATGKLTTIELTSPAALYQDATTDNAYMASLNDVYALFTDTTARLQATWRRVVVLPAYETFSWLMVESDFLDADDTAASAVVNIYNDAGTLICTTTVSSRDPVRLPSFREREIQVEVISKARITGLAMASSSEELKRV